jgi:ribosomal protein S18 acetylase RimI-like enzyme
MNHNHALHQIEANMRAVGRQERTVLTQEAFELFISPSADEWLSFATPLSASRPNGSWVTAVAEMQAAFATHGRRPRLEYIADLHPNLAPALEEGGLVCQSNNPVMWLETAELAPPPKPFSAARYQRLTAEDEPLLRAYLSQQSIAFGGTGGDDSFGWLPTLQSGLGKGLVWGAVLAQDDGLVSGAVIQMGNGLGELAGVWTAPEWRGRGLAYAVCHQLLAEYTTAGYAGCWLSAAEGAQRLYAKLGFGVVGTQLNYGVANET